MTVDRNGTLDRIGLGGSDAAADWQRLAERRTGMAWRHLARSQLPMADLAAALRAEPGDAPRTGHVADWSDIWRGRSTVLDYNAVICAVLKIGYPLLYDFTQTETAGLDGGDTLFLPGSLVRGGVREELQLCRWKDGRFVAYDRSEPLFLPYVQVRRNDRSLPLLQLHRENQEAPAVDYHSALWTRHRHLVEQLLVTLVTRASDDRTLGQVFDRVVHRDGRVRRVAVVRENRGFRAGAVHYASAAELVAAALLPLKAAAARDDLGGVLRELPQSVPLASVDVVALSYAILGTHHGPAHQPAGDGQPDVHVQWGALAMAGCPPRPRGYFVQRAGKVRWMYDAVVAELPWASPTMFVIAPVAPYFLWVPARELPDLEAIERLLKQVRARTVDIPDRLDLMAPTVRRTVGEWLGATHRSTALRSRLEWRSRLVAAPDPLPQSELLEPAGFGELSVAQACLVVSALIAAVTSATTKGER